ncbi:ribosomal RNA small subunit methyltransferase A [bacterium]|nr:ribosomal RNA small subunit methyltransferase A [bacterium]
MIQPIKRLGQNFLQDPNTIRKIVDSLGAETNSRVVEIGPGTGALTKLLSERYSDFMAIEIDPRAVEWLSHELPGVRVVQGDVLEVDWVELAKDAPGEKVSAIGNLPYYITSQILFGLLDAAPVIREAVIMMQYEVAARLTAAPRTKDYGILSVATQLACTPKLLFPVSRNVFYPKPDVKSAIVRLEFPQSVTEQRVHPEWLRRVIRSAFNQRRKTLRNSLSAILNEVQMSLPDELGAKRAEELSPQEFVDLALYLHKAQ